MLAMPAGVDLGKLIASAPPAPALLPAHLDCWVQTAPIPALDPDPALFLHGEKSGPPDVRVVFRADLRDDQEKQWAEVVSLCPPSSSEALPVRIGDFKKWLAAGEQLPDDLTDVEGTGRDEEIPAPMRKALRWEGPEKSKLIEEPDDVRPNATYVVPVTAEQIDLLGAFPPEGQIGGRPSDHGDAAFQRSRDRAVLRLTGAVVAQWPMVVQRAIADALGVAVPEGEEQAPPADALHAAFEGVAVRHEDGDDVSETLSAILDAITSGPEWLTDAAKQLLPPKARLVARHPAGGLVLTGKRRLRKFDPTFADDESSESPARRQVTLEEHTRGVMAFADRFVSGCGLWTFREAFALAAQWHDLGKADPRFQAMLRAGSPRSAAGRELLAKSGAAPTSLRERDEARGVHLYPKGGRHELLSLSFAAERTNDPLILHLIFTHHGDGRPFAAPYQDNSRDQVADLLPKGIELCDDQFPWPKSPGDPFTANATGPDQFWHVVRRFGWWGSAYLEATFRLADHAASRAEQEKGYTAPLPALRPVAPQAVAGRPLHELLMTGLEGSNPLAFLAAVGVLRSLTDLAQRRNRPDWLGGEVKLSWGRPGAPFGAVLHLPGSPAPEEVAAILAERLDRDLAGHPAALAVALAEGKDTTAGQQFLQMCRTVAPDRRDQADWAVAHYSELVPDEGSQLLIVRSDYLRGNVRSILERTTAEHIRRAVFARWDYADGLDNQSLHWEPSEDRRHAYQWHQPNGDPTKKRRGGMLGANRLALEAWPLFLSVPFPKGGKLQTRGFQGDGARNTFWTWPVWSYPVSLNGVVSLLALPELQEPKPDPDALRAYRVFAAFRSQRILVQKTPNLTPAVAV
jgi:CRISPR-associated endonuclease/helicase Cas3